MERMPCFSTESSFDFYTYLPQRYNKVRYMIYEVRSKACEVQGDLYRTSKINPCIHFAVICFLFPVNFESFWDRGFLWPFL